MRDVILHAFNWQYSEIIEYIEEIRNIGYGAILIPPPIYSDPNGSQWWQVYQPKDYRILLSRCGNKAEIGEIVRRAHSDANRPLRVYADLLINHMANEDRDDHFTFPGNAELRKYTANRHYFESNKLYGNLDEGLFSPHDFHLQGEISPEDYRNNRYRVERFRLSGLPDLKANEWVLKQQRLMVKALVDLGFDGFRIDAAKHLVEEQIDNIVDQPYMRNKFVFGEVIAFNMHEKIMFLDLFLRRTHVSAYDFGLHGIMKGAFEGGSFHSLVDPVGAGNALPWSRAVTFIVNHDLPNNENFRASLFRPHEEYLAHAYLLGKDGGVPIIYSDHNESAGAHPEDRDRWAGAYRRKGTKAMITFHNAVHGEGMNHLHVDDNVMVFRRGSRGIIAINKSHEERFVTIDTSALEEGVYRDLIHNHEMNLVRDRGFELCVTAREAYMWLK
jgi:alpha-amylase